MIAIIVSAEAWPVDRNEARRVERAVARVENARGVTLSLVVAPSPINDWIIPAAGKQCAINGRPGWATGAADDWDAIIASVEEHVAPVLGWLEARRARGKR